MENYNKHFIEEYNDDGYFSASTKETFQHEDDGFSFLYKFCITAVDMRKAGNPDYCIMIQTYMTIQPENWCEESLFKAAKLFGMEDLPKEEVISSFRGEDIVASGYAVLLESRTVEYHADNEEGFYDVLDCHEAAEEIESLAEKVEYYQNLRGFYLDRPANRIGTIGWDIIKEALYGDSSIEAGLKRIREGMKH